MTKNEFTKEELQLIYAHMENEPLVLMNKVQSMIENYCEHGEEYAETTYATVRFCSKCLRVK